MTQPTHLDIARRGAASRGTRARSRSVRGVRRCVPVGFAMLAALGGFSPAAGQQPVTTTTPTADGASIHAVIGALYESISGPAGEARNSDRLRALFIPGAQMIPTGQRSDGTGTHTVWTVDEYLERNEALLVEIGFREIEIGRVVEQFGNIAHVYSAYEAFGHGEAEPLMRGINSIQLWYDGRRWWIAGLMWQQESSEHPIPDRYLVPPA